MYADRTRVPVVQTRADIEKVLTKYGADQFLFGWDKGRALVRFRMKGRHISFQLPLPDRLTEQQARSRWRGLFLVIKAKLEAVHAGISVFDDEFLPHIVLPNGQTVGDFMRPQIERSYQSGDMPNLLPGLPPPRR